MPTKAGKTKAKQTQEERMKALEEWKLKKQAQKRKNNFKAPKTADKKRRTHIKPGGGTYVRGKKKPNGKTAKKSSPIQVKRIRKESNGKHVKIVKKKQSAKQAKKSDQIKRPTKRKRSLSTENTNLKPPKKEKNRKIEALYWRKNDREISLKKSADEPKLTVSNYVAVWAEKDTEEPESSTTENLEDKIRTFEANIEQLSSALEMKSNLVVDEKKKSALLEAKVEELSKSVESVRAHEKEKELLHATKVKLLEKKLEQLKTASAKAEWPEKEKAGSELGKKAPALEFVLETTKQSLTLTNTEKIERTDSYQDKIKALESQLKLQSTENESIRDELVEKKNSIIESEEKWKKIEQKLRASKATEEDMRKKESRNVEKVRLLEYELKQLTESYKDKIKTLENQLKLQSTENESIRDDLEEKRKLVIESKEKWEKTEQELRKSKANWEDMRKQESLKDEKLKLLEDELKQQTITLECQRSTIEKKTKVLSEYDTRKENLTAQIDKLQKSLATVEKELQEQKENVESLKNNVERRSKDAESMLEKLELEKNAHLETKQKNHSLKDAIEESKIKMTKCQVQEENIKMLKDKLKSQMNDSESARSKMALKMNSLEKELQEEKENLGSLKNDIRQRSEEAKSMLLKLELLNKSHLKTKQQNNALKAELQEYKAEMAKLKVQEDNIKMLENKLKKQMTDAESVRSKMELQMSSFTKQKMDLEATVNKLKSRLAKEESNSQQEQKKMKILEDKESQQTLKIKAALLELEKRDNLVREANKKVEVLNSKLTHLESSSNIVFSCMEKLKDEVNQSRTVNILMKSQLVEKGLVVSKTKAECSILEERVMNLTGTLESSKHGYEAKESMFAKKISLLETLVKKGKSEEESLKGTLMEIQKEQKDTAKKSSLLETLLKMRDEAIKAMAVSGREIENLHKKYRLEVGGRFEKIDAKVTYVGIQLTEKVQALAESEKDRCLLETKISELYKSLSDTLSNKQKYEIESAEKIATLSSQVENLKEENHLLRVKNKLIEESADKVKALKMQLETFSKVVKISQSVNKGNKISFWNNAKILKIQVKELKKSFASAKSDLKKEQIKMERFALSKQIALKEIPKRQTKEIKTKLERAANILNTQIPAETQQSKVEIGHKWELLEADNTALKATVTKLFNKVAKLENDLEEATNWASSRGEGAKVNILELEAKIKTQSATYKSKIDELEEALISEKHRAETKIQTIKQSVEDQLIEAKEKYLNLQALVKAEADARKEAEAKAETLVVALTTEKNLSRETHRKYTQLDALLKTKERANVEETVVLENKRNGDLLVDELFMSAKKKSQLVIGDVSKINEAEQELVKAVLSDGIQSSNTDFNVEASKEQVKNIDDPLVKEADLILEPIIIEKHSNNTVSAPLVEADLRCLNSDVTANSRAPLSSFVENFKAPNKNLGFTVLSPGLAALKPTVSIFSKERQFGTAFINKEHRSSGIKIPNKTLKVASSLTNKPLFLERLESESRIRLPKRRFAATCSKTTVKAGSFKLLNAEKDLPPKLSQQDFSKEADEVDLKKHENYKQSKHATNKLNESVSPGANSKRVKEKAQKGSNFRGLSGLRKPSAFFLGI